jgi:hypothetical protein
VGEEFEFQTAYESDQRRCAGVRSATAGGPEFIREMSPLDKFPVAQLFAKSGVATSEHDEPVLGSNQRLVVGLLADERDDEFDESRCGRVGPLIVAQPGELRGGVLQVPEERLADEVVATAPEQRETTIAAVLAADATHAPEPPKVQAARRALRDLPVELDRVLAAIRAGMDPNLAVITTQQIQRDLAAAKATISAWEQQHDAPAPLTADDIREALGHAGDLAALLAGAERETRARLYQALDLELLLDPVGDSATLDVRLQLCGGGGRI